MLDKKNMKCFVCKICAPKFVLVGGDKRVEKR